MAIDSNIYFQQQVADIAGGVERGMRLSDMAKGRKLEQEQMEMAKQKQGFEMAQKKQARDLDLISRASADVKDQSDYDKRLGFLSQQGVDVSQMPKQFDPGLVNTYRQSALSTLEQIGQSNIDRDFQYGAQKDDRQFAYNQQKDGREFGLQKQRFALDQTKENFNQEKTLADMGLTREQFEADQQYKNRGMSLKEKELALLDRDKSAMQKYREAKLAQTQGASGSGDNSDLMVPGVGVALTKTDASQMKDASGMKQKFDRQIGELIKLREDYGNESFNKDAVARGEQLSKDLLLTYKNLAKLGVLSQSDEKIINEIIPSNPLGAEGVNLPLIGNVGGRGLGDAFNYITGQDPKLTKLKGFQKDINEDFANNVASRIRGGDAIASNLRQGFQQQGPENSGGMINEAQAAGGSFDRVLKAAPQMQGQDLEAFKWASQNAQDPRAQGILQNLNSKYGGR